MLYRDSVQISDTTCCLHGSISLHQWSPITPQKKTWFSILAGLTCCWTKAWVRWLLCVNLVVDFNHRLASDFHQLSASCSRSSEECNFMAAGGYPSTFVGCMLERCEGQQIQNKVAKVKEPLGVGITVESNDKKEKNTGTPRLNKWLCIWNSW